jgi:hypothetical protein
MPHLLEPDCTPKSLDVFRKPPVGCNAARYRGKCESRVSNNVENPVDVHGRSAATYRNSGKHRLRFKDIFLNLGKIVATRWAANAAEMSSFFSHIFYVGGKTKRI